MVLSRTDKRKRKEGDLVDLVDPLSGTNKRPKVHAQRKFAQGAVTNFIPPSTSVKEKEKTKPTVFNDVLANKCPNTEDFLTFLCFRGTSILPSRLNYFNVSAKREKAEEKKTTNQVTTNTKNSSVSSQSSSTTESPTSTKTNTSQKTSNKPKSNISTKKIISTNSVIQTKSKFNMPSLKVQALKKKLQEQRFAKQKIKSKINSSNIIRTRSRTDQVVIKSVNKLAPRKFPPKVEIKRHGLRSSGLLHHDKLLKGLAAKPKFRSTIKTNSKKIQIMKKTSRDNDVTSDEDNSKTETTKKIDKSSSSSSIMRKMSTRNTIEDKRITRSYRENVNVTVSKRPTRKTKEEAEVYIENFVRKLVSPDLENDDDNMSLDSFPELPNAKKISQMENESKTKVRLSTRSAAKDAKNEIAAMKMRRLSRSVLKDVKPMVLKNKRQLKQKRYCEIESDDEDDDSVDSEESTKIVKPITRKSSIKLDDGSKLDHKLRSASKKVLPVRKKDDSKNNTESESSKSNKEDTLKKKSMEIKRKRSAIEKKSDKTPTSKKNKSDAKDESLESEEETLGQLLSRMKKKKEISKDSKYESKFKTTKKDDLPVARDKDKDLEEKESTVEEKTEEIEEIENKEKETENDELKINSQECKISEDEEEFVNEFSRNSIKQALNILIPDEQESDFDEKPLEIDLNPDRNIPNSVEETSVQNCTAEPQPISELMKKDVNCGHDSAVCIQNMPQASISNWKTRLNMSTERIEKWLSESSLAKEENKIEMENDNNFKFEEVVEEKKPIQPRTHLSISTKIQHLVRPVNVTLSKLTEKNSRNLKIIRPTSIEAKIAATNEALANFKSANALAIKVTEKSKEIAEVQDGAKSETNNVVKNNNETKVDVAVNCNENSKVEKVDKCVQEERMEKKLMVQEKKSSAQPRKLFQKKIKERKESLVSQPNTNAFSPENESSVYAFESDNETMPINTPFRRRNKDGAKSSGETTPVKQDEKIGDLEKNDGKDESKKEESDNQTKPILPLPRKLTPRNFELPKNFANLASMQVLPLDKLSTSWSNVNCSSSIAVQVNLDEQQDSIDANEEMEEMEQKCNEISTQTDSNNDNDNDDDGIGHLFYIPLQAVTRNGTNLVAPGQQVIKGVAVKFDTEGPTGPNQRILLKAKLVTKSSITVARCPPVGTVQPTTRTPPHSDDFSKTAVSTSTSIASNSEPSTSNSQQTSNVENNVTTKNQVTEKTTSEKVVKSPKVVKERKSIVDGSKQTKRSTVKSKNKLPEICPTNKTSFPNKNSKEEARLVEAPTFHPTEKDFQDPLEYIDKIRPIAEKFGICRVVPPPNFKPECKVSDDMRFTAYNQYVHKMLHRWGPNVKEMMAIKKYLATQSITLNQPPWIGGMEIDLPHLYQTVQSLGGLKEVIEKKKWQKVADGMKIPKSAQDRVTKLDDIYCKYLLPYDTLSPEEREKLFDEVETEWKKKESRSLQRHESQSNDNEDEDDDDSSDDIEECIVKGRNMPLNAFYRIARNTQRMWFGENQRSGNEVEGASAEEVEVAFWKHVAEKKRHVCVHNASIDSSGRGFGFSVAKNSPFARHPWNLKVLTNNTGSILRSLGPLMGVTVPTLHVGMLFSACCWYRDPHGLPWIEYLHTGAKKIWYGIPDEHNNSFRNALMKMVPRYCKNKTIWLPSDTAMVPPEMLVQNGVPLCHTVQEPGQFIIVFPKAFTSSICTGYVVSESVYFAQSSWLDTAEQVFQDIKNSCEPSIFSLEKLLISLINDTRSQLSILNQILTTVKSLWEKEIDLRNQLEDIGLTNKEKLPSPDSGKRGRRGKVKEEDGDFECETCRANLSLSLVNNSQEESVYCLTHALQLLKQKKSLLKNCTLMYTYDNVELLELIDKLHERINAKMKKTNQIKK